MSDSPDGATERFPPSVGPMLATASGSLPVGDEWVFELKWDGIRTLAFVRDGAARFVSRNGNDLTPRWPTLQDLPDTMSDRTAVLDGEVVAFDHDGQPSFSALQHGERASAIAYLVFDLLHLDGQSTRAMPWHERRQVLDELAPAGGSWQLPTTWTDGPALQQASIDGELEGVMAKRRGAVYLEGKRTREWLKIKNVKSQELVIGGWLGGSGNRDGRIGALLVGYYDDAAQDQLHFAGRVGTGFSDAELSRLDALLRPLEQADSPFRSEHIPKGARFVAPTLVANVAFTEWTHLGTLRHPAYKGLRDDKDPRQVRRE
ncbi:MAG: non-homologous end-joining DNA ligase [Acidimicrobiales bacterium]